MIINRFSWSTMSAAAFVALLLAGIWPTEVKAEHASYKNEVFPILRTYCLDCHEPGGPGYEKTGLDLRTYESLMKGTKFGPVVTPGDAFTSNLMVLIEGRSAKGIRMPHRGYQQGPSKTDLKLLRAWINDGAKDSAVFKEQVLPILDLYCLECHLPGGKGYEESGLDMRNYENLMKGTKFGPIIVPGDAFSSNMMVLLEGRSKSGLKMPFVEERNLSRWEKHLIRAWINRGALNN